MAPQTGVGETRELEAILGSAERLDVPTKLVGRLLTVAEVDRVAGGAKASGSCDEEGYNQSGGAYSQSGGYYSQTTGIYDMDCGS